MLYLHTKEGVSIALWANCHTDRNPHCHYTYIRDDDDDDDEILFFAYYSLEVS